MKCQFCDQNAVSYVAPPLCEQHLDLAIFAEHLLKNRQPVTVETVQAAVAQAIARNGVLSITVDDVTRLMSGPFALSYSMRG